MKTWACEHRGVLLNGIGQQGLLALPLTAFFASRQCSGAAIRASMDWAMAQAQQKNPVIGSFHSPLEQSVLKLLLESGSPTVIVLARPVESATLSSDWTTAIEQNNLAVVSQSIVTSRLTSASSKARNDLVVALADEIVVAYASAGGQLSTALDSWRSQTKQVAVLVEDR